MDAWRGWYHVTGNTYGTWLPGDPRGWRDHGHRTHVEGDYHDPPPPGTYDGLHHYSQHARKSDSVFFDATQRRVAAQCLAWMLLRIDIEVIAISVDGIHLHILARFPDTQVRPRVGRAKKHASHVLRDYGLTGTVWAKKCRPLPVRDREHQVNVFNYIVSHGLEGAWVWTFRDGEDALTVEPPDTPPQSTP